MKRTVALLPYIVLFALLLAAVVVPVPGAFAQRPAPPSSPPPAGWQSFPGAGDLDAPRLPPPVPGLRVGQEWRGTAAGPVLLHYVIIDPKSGLRLRPVLGQRLSPLGELEMGLETVSSMARRVGALAAVNGTYFDFRGLPLGLIVSDGTWVSQPVRSRTAIGWNDEGLWVMGPVGFWGQVELDWARVRIDGFNRPRGWGEVVVYTPAFGRKFTPNRDGWEWVVRDGRVVAAGKAGMPIPEDGWVLSAEGPVVEAFLPLRPGDPLRASWGLEPDWPGMGISYAVGGGPRLLAAGRLHITAEEEQFRPDVREGRAPRTAVGLTADGQVILLAVSGRLPDVSIGVTLEELAELMRELGAVDAMNLDGGGSTTLVVGGRVLNPLAGGEERPVANSLAVLGPSQVRDRAER